MKILVEYFMITDWYFVVFEDLHSYQNHLTTLSIFQLFLFSFFFFKERQSEGPVCWLNLTKSSPPLQTWGGNQLMSRLLRFQSSFLLLAYEAEDDLCPLDLVSWDLAAHLLSSSHRGHHRSETVNGRSSCLSLFLWKSAFPVKIIHLLINEKQREGGQVINGWTRR